MQTSLFTTVIALACALGPSCAAARAPTDAKVVVQGFLDDVRSGRNPDAAARYFAPQVLAHQITSEGESTMVRTPKDYAAHVRDFLAAFGRYSFRVEDIIAEGDRVFVRWRQNGHHLGSVDGERPTGGPILELTSAVYRVKAGRIIEYWIQPDRKGLEIQLQRLENGSSDRGEVSQK